ncbi:unnamed protein product [Trichogramma brassicae]|uniref:Uncharacterized protein n=1 Tax=Trichogramma brassicae TaxID=86971 RepID=A0A6H5I8U1_9HYME|nr:unnamed protein product [Trichogramma brassicae]
MLFELGHERYQPVRIDARDKLDNTPLHFALAVYESDSARFLLEEGADPNAANAKGSTPLHVVCSRVLNDESEICPDPRSKLTPERVIYKTYEDLWRDDAAFARLFFEMSDDQHRLVQIDARDILGMTTLQCAVANLLPSVVDILLKRDICVYAARAQSAAAAAARCARSDRMNSLPARVQARESRLLFLLELTASMELRQSPASLGHAILMNRENQPYMSRLLWLNNDVSPYTSVSVHAYGCFLVHARGASLYYKVRWKKKVQPHFCATGCGDEGAHDFYRRFDLGSFFDEQSGLTQFHEACMHGCLDVVVQFLELGQDPNCLEQIASGIDPPLHLALRELNNGELVQTLLRAGADPNLVCSKDDWTALHVICRRPRFAVDMATIFFANCTRDLQLDARDNEGDTPLHLALDRCDGEVAEILLGRGADPTLVNARGETPLHVIVAGIFTKRFVNEFFALCDEFGWTVQLDARDNEGNTPLHRVLDSRGKEAAEILLRRGADPTLVNARGETPLHVICRGCEILTS